MPDIATHLSTADSNEQLANRLSVEGEYGWGITCLFYSALHLVEAYLVQSERPSRTHRDRDFHMRDVPQLSGIHRRYMRLKQESERSRYDGHVFTPRAFEFLHKDVYEPVASYVRNLVTA